MSESETPAAKPNRAPFILTVVLLLVLGALAGFAITRDSTPTIKVGLITSSEDEYWDLIFTGAKDAAENYNVDLTLVKSAEDVETQNKHLDDLISQGCVAIGVSVVDADAQTKKIDGLAQRVALATFDADAPDSKRIAYVGSSNYYAGSMCAAQVNKAAPDGGKVVIICGSLDKANIRERRQGFIDELIGREYNPERNADPADAVLEGQGYTIVATMVDNGDSELAAQHVREALAANPDLRCVVGLQAPHGPAALAALAELEEPSSVSIVAFDEEDALEQGLKDGRIFASILQDQYMCGYETVRLLAEAARGDGGGRPEISRHHILQCYVLTAENLDYFRRVGRVQ